MQSLYSGAQFSCLTQNVDYHFGLNPFLQRLFPQFMLIPGAVSSFIFVWLSGTRDRSAPY
jgi:hypothetical protein